MKTIESNLRKLIFDHLREWAGDTILERGKGYVKQVDRIARTEDNTLVARVIGSEDYVTSVYVGEKGDFEYSCTCSLLGSGKHAIAVVLAAWNT